MFTPTIVVMTASTQAVAPVLRRTPAGWLAASPPEALIRFAVTAPTEEEAMAAYRDSYEKWREIDQRPAPLQ